MEYTEVDANIGKDDLWYFVNFPFSENSKEILFGMQEKIRREFPDSIWCTPKEALHITLMDWISPGVEYAKDKKEVFEDIFQEHDTATSQVLSGKKPIELKYIGLKITSTAIIALFEDDGSFQEIRNEILSRVEKPEETKGVPNIIHSTLIRFAKEIPLEKLEDVVWSIDASFSEMINKFQLGEGRKRSMVDYDVIKTYKLKGVE